MPTLGVVVGSVREGRVGLPIAQWFVERATQHAAFEAELLDLKVINLPIFAERMHPRLRQYESEPQKAWSATVARLDAFVFVTPEYNYSIAPALLNAIDYLSAEWAYKAVGFVSYGGVSGGLRAVQMAKQTVTAVRMVPIVEAVNLPFVAKLVEGGVFKAADVHDTSAAALLDELVKWTGALASLRAR